MLSNFPPRIASRRVSRMIRGREGRRVEYTARSRDLKVRVRGYITFTMLDGNFPSAIGKRF